MSSASRWMYAVAATRSSTSAHRWQTTRPPVGVILASGIRPSLDARQRSWDDEVVEVCARCGAVRECRPAEHGGAAGSFLVFVVLLYGLGLLKGLGL